ncbi:PREDICTED: fatty acid 2-hydroxylase [Dufourea novaeangliae]|uniref:Fatty acid 2-hydroxylase n=1 Tax=Dufourea novaeangliae TaxID=178035 RepID=A0A154PQC5_DUFNO|nr:PREDICTED: fatty acid 2-hydroxylase [Dufourea novaeangliae]KZC14103.1 Fatty acid 2-hydroxylase [Dufourea novaeangliae]
MKRHVKNGGDRKPIETRVVDRQPAVETTENTFLISYRDRSYDLRKFLRYHPGGKKVLGYFENRSLDKALDENPHSRSAFHLLEDFTVNEQEKYQEYEDLIDWNAPILGQVGKLGDQYWEWMNLPVNREIRLFQSNLLETISITPWYLVPIVWIPVCIYFLYSGFNSIADDPSGNTLFQALSSYILGILLWSILEYVLHRKLFHFKPPATSKLLISLHFILHGVHHKAPFDNRRLVFPPVAGLSIAKLLWYLYEALFSRTMIYFIAAGTTTGYVCYDLIHYYLHHGAPRAGSYLYTMKRNHNYHHFSHHELGFGISSKLWDHAFGTNICLPQLTKPIEW